MYRDSSSSDLMDGSGDLSKRIKRLIPVQTQDKVAMFIFLVICPLIFSFVLFTVLPTWYPTFGEAWVLRVVPIVFMLANTYVNYLLMIRHGPNGRHYILPNTFKAGFRYCHHCHTNAPPRSHHCPVCNVCILRRDHHCSFGAVCIGHFNQRYFCAAIVNLFCAALPCFLWTWEWMHLSLGQFSAIRYWQLIMPHVALMLSFLSVHQFACVGLCALVFTILLFTSYLISAQAFCIFAGQTRVEYLLEVHAYQLGLLDNLRQCLGTRWYLTFALPFIPSPLPSDGQTFQTRDVVRFNHEAKSM